jgi:hypothetical protein
MKLRGDVEDLLPCGVTGLVLGFHRDWRHNA